MNATPAPDGRPQPHSPGACGTQSAQSPQTAEASTVPRQKGRSQEAERLRHGTTDLLDHPDPHTAAQAAAVENLLRCWVRENDMAPPEHGSLRIPLEASGTALLVPVDYWSPTGWHRFGPPCLQDGPATAPPVDAVTVAALLSRETARTGASGPQAQADPEQSQSPSAGPSAGTPRRATETDGAETEVLGLGEAVEPGEATEPAEAIEPEEATDPTATESPAATEPKEAPEPSEAVGGADLVARVADSVRRTADFIADRRNNPSDTPDLFLAAEQSLLLGHPLHPTPKSREGLSDTESRLYSPELRGAFPLHWLAVDRSVLAMDSAWTERGRTVTADQLAIRLAGPDLVLPDNHAVLPAHPWQIRELRHRPETAALLDAGLLKDLGPHGAPWHPTSSVRTLYRSGAPAMLKLSLALRITNSRRENLRKELHRGVEVHRLLRSGLAEQWQAAHPGFDVIRDPAWLAVTGADGEAVAGFDVMIRHNPFRPGDDVACVAGLVSPRPPAQPTGQDRPPMHSRLAAIITRLAGHTGRPRGAVATEWFLRYLQNVVRPVLWLDSEAGVALEAHQQNTLLLLDPDGWPTGGRYRDNQGYYFRESRRAELDRRLPGIGRHSDTFVSDEVTDERFAYYLGVNNVLGLIGALGAERLADERLLLAAFRRFLLDVASGPDRLRTPLPARLLDSPVLRCKANLLTRLHGLDELVGPVDTQSVYVTISNPLHK
ncbi:IucA/IucC family protein [Streptomyces flavofungini]|uniref:IucA/IucC family protein n=1 Tax=Streptomyces flavofungini TaxID=68200 RepID=UPI0025B1E51C|nr:IucA/IucC family protein [Streptomyces flavofungini]WJV45741.1 IucA/IucC family protein [Streptomyces flavofungini]